MKVSGASILARLDAIGVTYRLDGDGRVHYAGNTKAIRDFVGYLAAHKADIVWELEARQLAEDRRMSALGFDVDDRGTRVFPPTPDGDPDGSLWVALDYGAWADARDRRNAPAEGRGR